MDDDVTSALDALRDQITELQGKVGILQGQVDTLNQQLDTATKSSASAQQAAAGAMTQALLADPKITDLHSQITKVETYLSSGGPLQNGLATGNSAGPIQVTPYSP